MVNGKLFCHLTILLLSFSFMVVKCSLEPTDQFPDTPTDTKLDALILHKRPSFFVGSRYGRSGSSSPRSSVFATSKTRRLNVVPRNDRFFLSSRYGKRAGMDFTQSNNKNNNQNNLNDNFPLVRVPLLSTPYEQALISEVSAGTQLSSKPIPQQQQQFNDDFAIHSGLPKQTSSSSSSYSLSSVVPPYAYMSCIYTGLQNYYRCNSMNDGNYALSTDTAFSNNDHADETDDTNVANDDDVDESDKK